MDQDDFQGFNLNYEKVNIERVTFPKHPNQWVRNKSEFHYGKINLSIEHTDENYELCG